MEYIDDVDIANIITFSYDAGLGRLRWFGRVEHKDDDDWVSDV